jgi:hypothetical protein
MSDHPSRGSRAGLAILAGLIALSAGLGALGLATGFLDLGRQLTARLPLHSPVLGSIALMVVVALPCAVLAWLAGRGDRRTGAAAVTAGLLLVGWIVVEVAFLRQLSFFYPVYLVLGAVLVGAGAARRSR